MHSSCRVCLEKFNSYYELSDSLRDSKHGNITFIEAYNDCTQLQARFQDELPNWICIACGNELQLFYEFLCKARKSDAKLREIQRTRSKESVYEEAELDGSDTTETEVVKDPLEETEDEDTTEADNELEFDNWNVNIKKLPSTASDDEDDRPLKHLLDEAKQIQATHNTNKEQSTSIYHENDDDFPNNSTFHQEDEDECDFSNNPIGNDHTVTPEAQIFPQGRFKCTTCEKTYFTSIGLKAHHEVHLPKGTATKKKRIRGPNKKKRKSKSTVEELEIITPNEIQPNSLETEETIETVESKETEAIVVVARKPRKPKLPKPKKMFPCHVCGKHMISASKLRYHMVMHTGEKDFLCTMCPKAYSTIYALKHHMRTHTGERPYECKFCGDKFTRPTTLRSHMRRHTGERPYGCEICGKRFIQHSSMTTHMKLNHMAKTIPCPHCDKKYARQTDLNTHLLSHTGDKPFSCHICPSRFIRQANLNKHMNQHHSGKTNEAKSTKLSAKRTTAKSTTTSFLPISDVTSTSIGGTILLPTSSVSPTLSVGSANTKVPAVDQNQLSILSSSSNVSNQPLQATAILPTVFVMNSPATSAFTMDSDGRQDLGNDHHAESVSSQAPTVDNSMQQSHLYTETMPSIEDLNRWNWPSHS